MLNGTTLSESSKNFRSKSDLRISFNSVIPLPQDFLQLPHHIRNKIMSSLWPVSLIKG